MPVLLSLNFTPAKARTAQLINLKKIGADADYQILIWKNRRGMHQSKTVSINPNNIPQRNQVPVLLSLNFTPAKARTAHFLLAYKNIP